jgi:hypothetical protein
MTHLLGGYELSLGGYELSARTFPNLNSGNAIAKIT